MPRWLIDSTATGGPALVADAVAKATILLCLTTALAVVLHRSAAAVRHRLWTLALGGLLVVPLLSWSLPGWRLPILPAIEPPSRLEAGLAEATRPAPARPVPAPAAHTAARDVAVDATTLRAPAAVRSEAPGAPGRGPGWLTLVWVVGFVAAVLPALVGVIGNERRRRGSRPAVEDDWRQLLDGLAGELALRRRIELRLSPMPLIPVTWGIARPVILLPAEAEQWPEPVRRLVLLHELAHIQRGDVGFQLLGRVATAFYWFHPLAWYALHRLRAECECACDDHVVHLGTRRTDYARQLIELARALRAVGMATAVPLARESTLETRIRMLFDDRRSHQPLGARPALAMLAASLVFMFGLAMVHPARSEGGQVKEEPRTADQPLLAKPDQFLPKTYTHPITITGRAVDPSRKPVRGARVYLASMRAKYGLIAETTTDGEGRYEFRALPLPIERANTVTGRDHGAFEVFGQAHGMGFAWRPQKWYYPRPKPANIRYEPDHRDPPSRYEASDKIDLDLHFFPAARLAGTIVDDEGKPRPGVRVEIRQCESLKVVDNVVGGWELNALNQAVPASMNLRTTDARGRFEFTDLPVDCRFWIHLRAEGFPDQSFNAATTDGPQPDHHGAPVLTGELKVVYAKPIDVPVKMVYGDTGAPAPKVAVQTAKIDVPAVSGYVTTLVTSDEQGLAILKLPRGKYRMENWPARGTPYLVTEDELVVGPNPRTEPFVAKLRPAGIVEVTVVDAETGAGIADVDVWEQSDPNGQREPLVFRSWEVASRIAWRESPRTDAQGKLRALVEPQKRRIGVGLNSYPRGFKVVEAGGQEVECGPGETVRLKFTMRKRGF